MDITIRGIDEEAWRQFRSIAVRKGIPAGKAVTIAIRTWAKEQRPKKGKPGSFFDFEAAPFDEPAEHASRETDQAIYG